MSSPFPGMDPFLESEALFPDFRLAYIVHLLEGLKDRLPVPYFAIVLRHFPANLSADDPGAVPCPSYIELRRREDAGEQPVASITVLDASDKDEGAGHRLYVSKQTAALARGHLLEIDLLRGGQPTTKAPIDVLNFFGPDYHMNMTRFASSERHELYAGHLTAPLPTIDLPLLPGDGTVPIDLQAVVTRVYDTGPYARRIDYAGPVPPPDLRPPQAEWVEKMLQEKGLRPGKMKEEG